MTSIGKQGNKMLIESGNATYLRGKSVCCNADGHNFIFFNLTAIISISS